MELEIIAIVLAVLSTIVTFVDTYLNQFRRGRVSVPPLRAYRLEPLNFHRDGDSYRAVRLTTALTFVNTGALSRVVDNLRIRTRVPGEPHDLVFDWENECSAIEQSSHEGRFATQPTLGPYESISKIYAFGTKTQPEIGKQVSRLEQYGTDNPEAVITATVEMLAKGHWVPCAASAFVTTVRTTWRPISTASIGKDAPRPRRGD